MNISYKDHATNEEVRNRIQNAIGVHDDLINMDSDGMATSQDPPALRRQFCMGQRKEQEGEEDRRRDGKMTSKNGQKWIFEIP